MSFIIPLPSSLRVTAQAVEAGEVALEGGEASSSDPSKPPVPLLKDKFGAERRKAKVLNFSIAYGKTAHGLAKDFGTSVEEAAATVERWYRDRWEVKAWQEATIKNAERSGEVRTLLGRTRPLRPDINSTDRRVKAHAERAAINTPIQGSAADVATAAMLAIDACPRLKALGWRLLMQVHDEVILEGPKASAGEAKALVVAHMTNPWAALMPPDVLHPLRVELSVDAKVADTWYEAK